MGRPSRTLPARPDPTKALDELCAADGPIRRTTLIVAAHPDDEAIGLAGRLHRFLDAHVLHVTDGAPVAPPLGVDDPQRISCRQRRAGEALAALERAGIDPARRRSLDVVDQQAIFQLEAVARALALILRDLRPAVVVTHAYEGGHPDHDATALAVALAIARSKVRPVLIEMAGYHGEPGRPVWGAFIERREGPAREVRLDAAAIAQRRRVFEAYASQAEVLARFPLDLERFRLAPSYDFGAPPHLGTLHYEREGWADGVAWRLRAREVMSRFTLHPPAGPGR